LKILITKHILNARSNLINYTVYGSDTDLKMKSRNKTIQFILYLT
jgi:hypothetical protein